jgi:hypothetical protein
MSTTKPRSIVDAQLPTNPVYVPDLGILIPFHAPTANSAASKVGEFSTPGCGKAGSESNRARLTNKGVCRSKDQPGEAPWIPTYTAYNDVLPSMNSRLRFGPPKVRFPTTSGTRMRPSNLALGFHTVTPL